ncbi:MAG: 3-dehydroquinate synthase [Saprospiraceae bacterium]|nr:3-dehydroquinate synthase [Saprospiraceae bacterium]
MTKKSLEPTSETIHLTGYQIHIGSCLDRLNHLIQNNAPSKVIVLADHHTEESCLTVLKQGGLTYDSSIVIAAGEKHKSLSTCEKIWQRLFDLKADRHSLLINLGGGVIGDMGGFCASTYMRGISFIQVPTTLLSQVDASIGGKLGIDFYGLKNSIGLFKDPLSVLVDPGFLATLPAKELRSGYAEVVKHGLIRDRDLWEKITQVNDWSNQPWQKVIHQSLLVKKDVVAEDPLEKSIRKILNFGHTIGHAIESVMIDIERPILHGEAVAAGMIAEAFLSHRHGTLTSEDLATITTYLLSVYGQLPIQELDFEKLIRKMGHDKKNIGSAINFTFLDSIGSSSINHTATIEQIRESIDYYSSL